jgi:hypothetical protein
MHTRDGHRPATQRCEDQRGMTRGLTGERVGGAAGRVAGVELGNCACVWWSSVAPVLVAGAPYSARSSDLARTKPSMASPVPGPEWPGTAKTGGGGRE